MSSRKPPPGRRGGFGRAKGTPNKATTYVRDTVRALTLGNEVVVRHLKEEFEKPLSKWRPSTVAVFNKILEYGYPKPKTSVEIVAPSSDRTTTVALLRVLSREERLALMEMSRKAVRNVIDVHVEREGDASDRP